MLCELHANPGSRIGSDGTSPEYADRDEKGAGEHGRRLSRASRKTYNNRHLHPDIGVTPRQSRRGYVRSAGETLAALSVGGF